MGRKPSRKRLTKAELYYIEGHCGSQTAKEMAYDLRIPESLIQKHIDKLKLPMPSSEVDTETTEQPVTHDKKDDNALKAGKLFARKKDRGVVVMTPEAAELSDAVKQKTPKINKGCIHEINPE